MARRMCPLGGSLTAASLGTLPNSAVRICCGVSCVVCTFLFIIARSLATSTCAAFGAAQVMSINSIDNHVI